MTTLQMAKLGPDNNSTTHIYIYTYIYTYIHIHIHTYIHTYIYIYAVKLLSGPSLGFFNVILWSKLGFLNVIIWSKFVFLTYKNSGFKRFGLHTQLSFCVFCAQLSGNFLKIAFFKKGAKIGFFNFQCFKYKI